MTRTGRRVLIGAASLLGLFVGLLLLLPLLFGGRIAERVRAEVNRSVDAEVSWSDAELGIIRNFPNLTLRLEDLSIAGIGAFEGDTLASIRELGVVVDLGSAIRTALGGSDPVVVRAIELDRPRLSLVALEDGSANWDIMKERADTAADTGRPLSVSLRRFTVDSGSVSFDNRAAGLRASLTGVDQTLRGDFGEQRFDIDTRLEADAATVEFAGMTYLNGVRLDLTADVLADMADSTFTLREGSGIRLNDLLLAADGVVASAGESLRLDLDFEAPTTDFRDILSLVPAIYTQDFGSIRTSGTMAVSGSVEGEYGPGSFPAFALAAKVADGAFQYPDLELPARDIQLDLTIVNPGGDADSTVVDLSRLHLVLGRNPIDAAMLLRTPVSDPDLDARVSGALDLADLRRTVKLENVDELAGTISANAAVRTRMSWVDNGQYDRVAASGTVTASDVRVRAEGLRQPLAVSEAVLALGPRRTELRSFSATAGTSDISAEGYLDNLLGYVLRDEDLRGSATINSRRFVLDEWRSEDSELEVIPVPAGLDFVLDATIGELLYDRLAMNDARGRVRIRDERMTLEDFTMGTLGGTISVDGFYETTNPARPTFDVGMRMYELDIPSAVEAFTTIQVLAPVAKYASGQFTSELRLTGPLSENMMPVFQALTGRGSLETSQLLIRDFPALERLAGATRLAILNDPTLRAIRSQFEISDGRFRVQPFTVGVGPVTMNVAGSNGIDQSLDYDLTLNVPRSLIGPDVEQAIGGVVSRAAGAGIDLQSSPEVQLGVELGGSITDPALDLNLGSAAGSVAAGAGQAVEDAAEQRAEAAADSVRQRAAAETERLVREAEERAEGIRAEGRALAERVKREGYERADSLVARAGDNPVARAAAEAAASRLRRESDENAARITREANARADALVEGARSGAGTE